LHLTDNFNITAGARYSDEEKNQVTRRLDPTTGGTTPSTIPPFAPCADPVTGECGRNTFATDRVDYRLALDYRFTEAFMAYASYATGFKSGGVSPRYFFANQFIPYDEEEATGSEIGLKTDLLSNTLRLNAAYFFNTYDDQQLGSPVCPTSCRLSLPGRPQHGRRGNLSIRAEGTGSRLTPPGRPQSQLDRQQFTRIGRTSLRRSSSHQRFRRRPSKYNLGIQYGI
jgi:outer membrane receptor protein involved in Fe transport